MSAVSSKHDWREDYRVLAAMTEADLRAAVEALPAEIREKLAEGPVRRRWSCGVCEAFGQAYLASLKAKLGEPMDADDPVWRAFAYHEIPKAEMRTANQQWYGRLANDTYTRCIATYRAAGWQGEAEEPNA